MSRVKALSIGCDVDVLASDAEIRGVASPDATFTWDLYEANRTTLITSGTMDYDADTVSDYVGVIPDSATGNLVRNTKYWIKVTGVLGSVKSTGWIECIGSLYRGR